MTFSKLTKTNNNYEVNSKVPFSSRTNAECDIQDLEQAFLFSWNMTFGATGEHRSYRSGGQLVRNNLQKFCDVFIGKLGEVAFFNMADSSGKCNSIKTSHNITGRIPSQCLSGAII